ncbi:MAG: OOP family OmpA-OmpF porin [Patiriisocius sp.]|jgi:OOP family OmpA-OmpF porin
MVFGHVALSAQNLVPNNSFEKHAYCPSEFNQGQMNTVTDWQQASRGTSDYFHSCSRIVGVPENDFGWQEAYHGEAYMGLITFSPASSNYREYIQAQLLDKLVTGQKYCVEFYISLAENSKFMTDEVGIILSSAEIRSETDKVIRLEPHISNPGNHILKNDRSWLLISDTYVAKGDEQHLIIGNFKDDNSTKVKRRNIKNAQSVPWDYSYYYVDNISVKPMMEEDNCSCTIPLIKEELKDSVQWKIDPMTEIDLQDVLFKFDKDKLVKKEKQKLNDVVKLMNANQFLQIEVRGHTDKIGGDNYNLELSERRANTVIDYLKERGIASDRISIKKYGSEKPRASNNDAKGRQQNRRVDFAILEKEYEDYSN